MTAHRTASCYLPHPYLPHLQEAQLASFQQLDKAEGALAAAKAATHPGRRTPELTRRLDKAEADVAAAAAAAAEASTQLHGMLQDRQAVQAELAAVRAQLEQQQPASSLRGELHERLMVRRRGWGPHTTCATECCCPTACM
jgi:hypothetical protein